MPSGNIFPGSLSRRVRHLERSIQPDLKQQQRAYLEQRFTGPEYDGHRAQLIDALLSDSPQYHFVSTPEDGDSEPMAIMVSWYQRERLAPVVIRTYAALFAAL